MAALHKKLEGADVDQVKVTRALISLSDKQGLIPLAQCLAKHDVVIMSTGGTAKTLRDNGIKVMDVAEYTGAPEILDGRVKTLHPKIHGGILGIRGNPKHEEDFKTQGISPIDLVCVNLYPFEEAIKKGGDIDPVENIDIGGPCMVRASAKNHRYVAIVSSPKQYDAVIKELEASKGCTSLKLRRQLAAEAFALTAHYDTAISQWFAKEIKH